jgi:hypothetical protein
MGRELLPVIGQRLLATLAQPSPMLLQASQHGVVAVIENGTTMSLGIARAGVAPLLLLLRRSSGRQQNQRYDGKQESGHLKASNECAAGSIAFWRGEEA